ncbi:MAG: THxN family PEP-CTERM protein [Anaerolineaceae bacterium]|nr:THxN family PEP-CTERM protein [Anaerolineaceae bacterium]
MKLRLFSFAAIIVLLITSIPLSGVSAATDYELLSVSGIWTATQGGGTTVNGLNTNEVHWGYSSGFGQSGLRFDGSTGQSFNEGQVFLLGALTHMNWPVYSPSATGATLQITLNFSHPSISPNPSFTFDFDIQETPNTPGSCPSFQIPGHPACDDRITFPASYGQESFTIGDKYYTLKIEGFVDSYPSGSPVDYFVTEEKKNNSAYLVASLSSVLVEEPAIALTKKTNDLDVSSAPGPELVIGEGVTWDYIVQNTGNVDLSNVQVVDDQVGTITCPSSVLASGESMTCSATGTVAAGQYHNQATVTASHATGSVSDSDESWYYGVQPGIDVEKLVWDGSGWVDADSSPGPSIASGSDVLFKFVVQNTGGVNLSGTDLSDNKIANLFADQALTFPCAEPDPFTAGASFTCYGGLAWAAGQHSNVASVSGDYAGETYDDSDQAHYFGISPDIDVEKSVWDGSSWVDADSSPGPAIASGSDVNFRFVVKNTGNVELSGVALDDDNIATLFSDQAFTSPCVTPTTFTVGASFTCYGSLSWAAGQHENKATASGSGSGVPVEDADLAHYFGANASIQVEKYVWDGANWQDADSVTGPTLTDSGSDVEFKFVVTNTGNVRLSDVSLSDNLIASFTASRMVSSCGYVSALNPGESFTCYGSLPWAAGQHVNEATASGSYAGQNVKDTDKAHYFGAAPDIDVEKAVWDGSGWVDADSSPGPYLAGGSDVLFRFKVENTGNVDLTDVSLVDNKISSLYSDQGLTSPCVEPEPFTAGGSFTCYGSLGWVAGQHINEATASGDFGGGSYEDSDQAHYYGASPSVDVEKSIWNGASWEDADGATGPILWSSPSFRFVVTNTGNLVLSNVHLVDSDIASLYQDQNETIDCSDMAALNPGESYTCYGSLPWAAGQHEDTATVSASVLGGTVNDSDKAHYFGPAPDIDVDKRVWTGSAWADADTAPGPVLGDGSDALFRFVVTNTGNMTLTGVTLSDNLIANLYSDQALTIPCDENDPFGVGESFTCYGSLAWQSGQHENTASVSGSYDGHPVSDDDLAHYFGASVSIDVEKSIWDGTAWDDADTGDGPILLSGSDPIFKFDVTNTSNIALTNIVLEDNRISSLYSDQLLTTECVEPSSLSAGASFTCFGSLPWASGKHENEATVSAESNGIPASDSDLAHYLGGSPNIKLTKTADVDAYQQKDQIITYTFVAENSGNLTLYDVMIADPLPGLSVLDCSAPLPATLTPGSSVTCTATYQVTQEDMDRGFIENEADVQGTDIYNVTVEDDDGVNLEGPKEGASIHLEKTADPEIYVAVDDEITYTFVATNDGSFTLSDVTITDPLPDLSELICIPAQPASLQPGESMTCTATYKITQADINAGLVENTAVASGVGSNEEEVEDEDDAVVEGPKEEASIHLDKKVAPAVYKKVGDEITYTFTVTNNGIYTLTDVTVTDPLFSLTFGPIAELAPGESEVYKYTYTIDQSDIDAGSIENVATAMGYDPNEDPVSDTDEAVVDREKPKETVETLPTTGFAPNMITNLPTQSLAYKPYSNLWLEIPSLGVRMDIVGIPETESGWDVTWLGEDAGWLSGTTFPTWPGNSVVTGHVWNAYDQPGPFVDLNTLHWGDTIIVHLNGTSYIFEVRSKLTVEPTDMSIIEKQEDYSWLNLMTCLEFNEQTGVYDYRLVVRAVLIEIE